MSGCPVPPVSGSPAAPPGVVVVDGVTARPAASSIEAAMAARYPAWQCTQTGTGLARQLRRQFAQPAGQLVQRDVHRALDVAGRPLERAADVQDGDGRRAAAAARPRKSDTGQAPGPRRPASRQACRWRLPGDPVDADPGQVALRAPATWPGVSPIRVSGAPGGSSQPRW